MALGPINGTQLFIKVGDGADPETFAHPCMINTSRGIVFGSSSSKIVVPDCDNPDDPAWTEVVKDGLNATINGAGTMDKNSVGFWDTWFRSPDPKNVQVWIGSTGHWSGAFVCTNFQVTGDRNNKAQASITLESSGEVGAFT